MNLNPFIDVISIALNLYIWVIFAYIILGWLIYFGIVNRSQPFVYRVNLFLQRAVDPVLRKIRKYMPDLGGMDISPIILFLLIYLVQRILYEYFYYRG